VSSANIGRTDQGAVWVEDRVGPTNHCDVLSDLPWDKAGLREKFICQIEWRLPEKALAHLAEHPHGGWGKGPPIAKYRDTLQ